MRLKILIPVLLASLALSSGCKKKDCGCAPPFESYYYKGVVVNSAAGNCGLPMINFTEDSARFRAFTGSDFPVSIVKDLDPAFNVQGKKLWLNIKKLSASEDFICVMSLDYYHLGILDAKSRD